MSDEPSPKPLSAFDRLRYYWTVLQGYRQGYFGNPQTQMERHRELLEVMARHGGLKPKGANILDIGCGQLAPQTVLFKADGAQITGVDIELPTLTMGPATFYRALKLNGLERAVKSAARHILFDRTFFSRLSSLYGAPLKLDGLDLRVLSATSMPFADARFDFIYSTWVFEHVEDVPAALREISRVASPNAVMWFAIHLFPSLSGGHNPEWVDPDRNPSKTVPPWDHLRQNLFPVNAFLNKYRLEDFDRMFSSQFDVLDRSLRQEGGGILTPEIEMELAEKGYSRTDLLTHNAFFICRNRGPSIH